MKGRRRKNAQRLGEGFGGDRARPGKRAVAQFFGQERGACNGSRATSTKKARFRDSAVSDANRQFEDVATDRIADFDGGSCIGKLTGVAGVAEVIENSLAEHVGKYGNARRNVQRNVT